MTCTVAFLDAMIFMHYKPIEDIDWRSVLGADAVRIVVPRITVQELDKQKNTNRSPKVRERVGGVLRRLESYLPRGATLRPGVEITYYGKQPVDIDYRAKGLDREWNDDVLIATILQYRLDDPGADVVLVSHDTGPKLTALDHDLRVLGLPDELRLPPDADPLERENQELRRQIQKLQGARPELSLQFAKGGTHLPVLLHAALPFPIEAVAEEMSAMQQKYSPMSREQTRYGPAIVPAEEEYSRYERDRQTFLAAYEAYLKAVWQHENALRRTALLRLMVVNSGTQPAEDIDIYLHLPDGFAVRERERQPPTAPAPPVPPRTQMQMLGAAVTAGLALPNIGVPAFDLAHLKGMGNVSELQIKKSNSYEVSANVQRLKHGSSETLPDMHIEFESDVARSFTIDYALHAGNVPEEIKGQLHVSVKVRHGE